MDKNDQGWTQERAVRMARAWLQGWKEHSHGNGTVWFYAPDDVVNCARFGWVDEWPSAVVAVEPLRHGRDQRTLRAAIAEALRLYNARQTAAAPAAATAPATSQKPTSDWSFTASATNPPHLGRILREAREHGVRLLRVRCGEASRVFVERKLADAAVSAAGYIVSEDHAGIVAANCVFQPTRNSGNWIVVAAADADEARVIAACKHYLAARRIVKVEVLG